MNSSDVRQKYLEFFKKKGHAIIPSAPLIPKDDPTTLFTGSGMQSMMPYLLGEKHPLGTRIANSQRCFRAEDIEEVGDNRHTTFFEMLGNWSLGDYFKEKQLAWFFEFLTKEIGLDPKRLYVTAFVGKPEINIPKDIEAVEIWKQLFSKVGIKAKDVENSEGKGMQDGRIFYYEDKKNWWSRVGKPSQMPIGEPGGPDSELFFDFGKGHKFHENSPFKNKPCHVNCDCGRFLEIGNSVFMTYKKTKKGFEELTQKNIDFGGGLERIVSASQNQIDIFKTDLFSSIIRIIELESGKKYKENNEQFRVIADHMRAAVFMAQEGLEPSNKRQGYMMRRLIRKSVVKMRKLEIIPLKAFPKICQSVINVYGDLYFDKKPHELHPIIGEEIDSFEKTIHKGTKLLQTKPINGKLLFDLHQTHGFLFEISEELLKEWGKPITEKDRKEFEEEKKKHQEKSRQTSIGMFKGGLADKSEEVTKLHTATHLLHKALRRVLGEHVQQVGSNITAERLRFDFTHPNKLTDDEIKKIEDLVNEQIKKNLKVTKQVMSLDKAKKQGALAFFGQRYGEKVNVYKIGPSTGSGCAFSTEVCAGPHMDFTGKLGQFTMKKQETVGSGKRRIYGVLE